MPSTEYLSLHGGSPDLSENGMGWGRGQIQAWVVYHKLQRQSSSKLLGRVGEKNKTKTVELAIKYEWHILFNFACNFFLAHQ